MSLEDIVKSLATNTLQFQQETKLFQQEARANIQSLENHMAQMATAISLLEAQSSGKLPFQTVVNPRENASAIVLRSGSLCIVEARKGAKRHCRQEYSQ